MTRPLQICDDPQPALSPSPAKAIVGRAGAKGRGIFATVPIRPGEVILVDPTVELSVADCAAIRPTGIEDYPFAHPEDDGKGLLVMGLASLANHGDPPNASTEYAFAPGIGWLITLRAVRDLAAGEEITRRYACDLWFNAAPEA